MPIITTERKRKKQEERAAKRYRTKSVVARPCPVHLPQVRQRARKRLAEFLADKLRRRDIPLKELTETFITDYDLYLRSEKGLTPSCVCTSTLSR